MAVSASVVSVATTATLLSGTDRGQANTGSPDGMSLLCQIPTGGVTVYVGGPDVNTSTLGFPLPIGTPLTLDLPPGDALYGVVVSGTQSVNLLRTGV